MAIINRAISIPRALMILGWTCLLKSYSHVLSTTCPVYNSLNSLSALIRLNMY